jgi:hypothetical protein
MTEEMKALNDQMVNVRLDIRELSTKVDGLADVKKEVATAKKTADEALNYAKAGQHQINELKDSQKWLWRTVGAALITGLIGGAIAIIWQVLSK